MSFDLFGPATQNSIKVGYISTDRGFVDNVSICEANDYAYQNPGTTFIFRTRDVIRYLNINEVNSLTPNDLEPKSSGDSCTGIIVEGDCGPPKVEFYGGGGVGVRANPVVGEDGSILAVDLIHGGYGYQYPPIVEIKDNCSIGAGIVARSVLGEVVETVEYYNTEDDFEDYQLCDPNDVGYGKVYNAAGKDIGTWNPSLYAKLDADPIAIEIQRYQEFLKELPNPWWTTRKEPPLRVSTQEPNGRISKVSRTKFDVDYPVWNDFMNLYAISPVPPSDVAGSDFAENTFFFEWEEDFPYDGQYTFKGCADNVGVFYFDDVLTANLSGFNDKPTVIKKNVKAGVHKIKLQLKNLPITETKTSTEESKVKLKFIEKRGKFYIEATGSGSDTFGVTVEIDDSETNAGLAAKEIKIPSDSGELKYRRTKEKQTIKDKGVFSGGKIYGPIQIIGADSRSGKPIIKSNKVLALLDGDGQDANIKLTITGGGGEKVTVTEETTVAKSWNVNPMGVSFVINAPMPPIPQEPIPEQEGRCPRNPIWTTRFPSASQKWYPVKLDERWSEFMNRYAISPIPPLDSSGSDGGGVVYRNSWNIDIPYDGFYAVRGTRDNFGRVLIDGSVVSNLDGFKTSSPKADKIFLSRGSHTIEVEIENQKTDTFTTIDRKIFSTRDWEVPAGGNEGGGLKAKFIGRNGKIYIDVTGSGTGKISFAMDVDDRSFIAGVAAKEIVIPSDSGKIKLARSLDLKQKETIKGSGSFTSGKQYGPIQIVGAAPGSGEPNISNKKVGLKDADGTDENIKLLIDKVSGGGGGGGGTGGLSSGSSSGGASYSGPPIASYIPGYISPVYKTNEDIQGKTWKFVWSGINFPQTGQYIVRAEADDILQVRIDGQKVGEARTFQGVKTFYVNLSAGAKTLELELFNLRIPRTGFEQNPTYAFVEILERVQVSTGVSKAWTTNPIGVSAVLIPPPCPKRIRGKGVVTDVIINEPGNGFPVPQNEVSPNNVTTYPVSLRLKNVEVEDSGINYNCGVDQIQITPSNGAVLDYECDTFGRIINVKVLNPGLGFTRYPEITLPSNTGINALFRPQFEVVRDPIVIDQDKLIQVTDLVGLKQTGYVDGRAYYGSVYYKDGVRYAGFYETVGELVQVYDTLQESIDAQVTTRPSAIQRQGTDISSNDPRLNLPGTPENLI